MEFEDTPEYKQSIAMQAACNAVICSVFGVTAEAITRFKKASELFILDKHYAIDMQIRLTNGSQLTGQEKTLSNKFYKFRTFTIEFWQNRYTKEPGEFFKIASQFYLHGYSDETGRDFIEWKIIDILQLISWLRRCGTDLLATRTKPAGGSRAAFLPIPYDAIPEEFILHSWRRPEQPQAIAA